MQVGSFGECFSEQLWIILRLIFALLALLHGGYVLLPVYSVAKQLGTKQNSERTQMKLVQKLVEMANKTGGDVDDVHELDTIEDDGSRSFDTTGDGLANAMVSSRVSVLPASFGLPGAIME